MPPDPHSGNVSLSTSSRAPQVKVSEQFKTAGRLQLRDRRLALTSDRPPAFACLAGVLVLSTGTRSYHVHSRN
ncbi:hypothetical protein Plhal304r1_c018g0063851 [Plasmopara halstedii]